MARSNFENLKVYQLSEQLADKIWDIAIQWDVFAKDTVGKQILRRDPGVAVFRITAVLSK